MEADKSHSLQGESASWRSRKAYVVVTDWRSAVLRSTRANTSLRKAGKCLPYSREGHAFCSTLLLIRWNQTTWGRAICFTQVTESNVSLTQKYPHSQIMWQLCHPQWAFQKTGAEPEKLSVISLRSHLSVTLDTFYAFIMNHRASLKSSWGIPEVLEYIAHWIATFGWISFKKIFTWCV